MPDILSLSRRLRAAVEAQDEAALQRIIDAFQDRADVLEGDIDALSRDISDPQLTPVLIRNLPSFKRLMRDLERELDRYQEFLAVELALVATAMIALAGEHALQLLRAAFANAGTTGRPLILQSDVIRKLLDFLDPNGPLFDRIAKYGAANAVKIADLIVGSVQIGRNPREIARWIVEDGLGPALTDAMRLTRTVQLYAYREATRANYQANSDVVEGWVWLSALIPGRTCMSCVAMHGTIHSLDETLNDHHNGLCVMLPLVGENPIKLLGQAWFDQQSEAVQRQMMGPGKLEAWNAGKFSFGDLVATHDDDVYGEMRVEQSLKELVR